MDLTESPQHWELKITPENYGITGHPKFSGNSCSKRPKLYVLTHGSELLYVGICRRPISARLSTGFKGKGKGGYHRYAARKPEAIEEHGGKVVDGIFEILNEMQPDVKEVG